MCIACEFVTKTVWLTVAIQQVHRLPNRWTNLPNTRRSGHRAEMRKDFNCPDKKTLPLHFFLPGVIDRHGMQSYTAYMDTHWQKRRQLVE